MKIRFSDRLKQLRENSEMTQEDLAKILNTTKQSISNYEIGKREPDYVKLESIADTFNVDIDYLLGKTNYTTRLINPEINLNNIPMSYARKIPIISAIACGAPIFAQENYEGYFIADESIKADFVLKVKGDSMIDAEIYEGDLVFMKKVSDVENGKIAAVLINDEASLKKVVKSNDLVILQPCNINYEPILIDSNNDAMVLGEMVGVYHPVKNL